MGPISTNHSGCGIIWEGLVLSISNTEHCWQSSLGFYLHFCFSRFEICQWLTFSRWKSHGVSGPRFFFFLQILEKMISLALRFTFTSFGSPRWPPSYTWSGCLHGSYHSLEIVIDLSDWLQSAFSIILWAWLAQDDFAQWCLVHSRYSVKLCSVVNQWREMFFVGEETEKDLILLKPGRACWFSSILPWKACLLIDNQGDRPADNYQMQLVWNGGKQHLADTCL